VVAAEYLDLRRIIHSAVRTTNQCESTLSGDWDHGRKYLVATNSLLAQGGHNYREFLRAENVKQGQAQYEMVKRWIKEHSPVMTPPLGRIR